MDQKLIPLTSSANLIRMEMEITILRYWSHGLVNLFSKQTNIYPYARNANIFSSEHMFQDEEMRTLINVMTSKMKAERAGKGIFARLFRWACNTFIIVKTRSVCICCNEIHCHIWGNKMFSLFLWGHYISLTCSSSLGLYSCDSQILICTNIDQGRGRSAGMVCFCQLDICLCISGKRQSQLRDCSHRLACGALFWLLVDVGGHSPV